MKLYLLLLILLLNLSTVVSAKTLVNTQDNDRQLIAEMLNAFHQAAADANGDRYLNLLSDNAVFLGTDASERWTKKAFKAFVLPYFNKGKGWLYIPKERNISVLKMNEIALFDELVYNAKYGLCRGSGVVVNTGSGWKISQYSLAIMLPNKIAGNITKQIKNYEKTTQQESH